MIIGPFWCEQENYWLRFVLQGDVFSAEAAARNNEHPELTTQWITENNRDFWTINYKQGSQDSLNEGIRLQNGKLYHTNFIENRLTKKIHASVYNNTGVLSQFKTNKTNPFDGKTLIIAPNLTPYAELPLTPEIQAEREVTRQKERKQAEEAQNQKWRAWKAKNIHETLISASNSFTREQCVALYRDLAPDLIKFSPEHHPTFEAYKQALEDAISNENHPIHEKIQEFSGRTSVDREQGLNPNNSEERRAELFKFKQAFAYDLLNAERVQLLRDFNVVVSPIETVKLKSLKVSALKVPPQQDSPVLEEEDFGLQNALAEDLSTAKPAEETYKDLLKKAIALSLEKNESGPTQKQPITPSCPATRNVLNQAPVSSPEPPSLSDKTQLIKDAVSNAVTKYQEWYQKGTTHRGANGFFSWLRHGTTGQTRALSLKDGVSNCTDEKQAITKINDLLTDPGTRYHKHSLASFLLDELASLKDLPWHGLTADKVSKRFDSQEVSDHLASFKPK
jgi:hypothetical protein